MKLFLTRWLLDILMKDSNRGAKEQHDRQMVDPMVSPEHFVIRQHMGIGFHILFCVCALGFLAIAILCAWTADKDEKWISVIFLAAAIVSLFCIISARVWQIEVNGTQIALRTSLGKMKYFDIAEITKVYAKPVSMGIVEYKYKFYNAQGKKLFSLDEMTDDVYLIQRLKNAGVEIIYN